MSTQQAATPAHESARPSPPEPTLWTGWVIFAGITMIILGGFQAIEGFIALFRDSYYVVRSTGLVVHVDYTVWGWVHLILGGIAVIAGLGVLAGQMWARVLGIIFAVVSAIVNMIFLPAYPVASMLIIAFDVIVIYALAVHGRETKSLA